MSKKYSAALAKLVLTIACITCFSACSSVPSKDQTATALKKLLPMAFTVEQVQPVKGISGLYQVIVKAGGQPMVFYMDKKGTYIITGNLIEAQTKRNLTIDALQGFK